MVRRADLDEALQEEPRFAVLLPPDALEDFVRLEEVAVFGPRLGDDDLPPYRAADREGRAWASIVRRTSGV